MSTWKARKNLRRGRSIVARPVPPARTAVWETGGGRLA
ncbi:MAG: hypothetical protein HSCHL_1543 [Hydrogenibacillus schlegelii]|uniref:Uncharacterized protein n=1 Tax=Hydrogenibacillus schlegelii TaxID=1484 RepID=A0A2T5G4F5_HYDSH|nr:MAG: hypothetical protein HSCHL_1543 [Hydrogenibacillus schlegelii]